VPWPWLIDRAIRDVRDDIDGLPEEFTFHDLRHYLASLLIASGADIKTVQARMRHASARNTLDTYSHLWPDADESTRTAVGAAIMQRHAKRSEANRARLPNLCALCRRSWRQGLSAMNPRCLDRNARQAKG